MCRKSDSQPARLSFIGHALMENRNGLAVDARATQATGTAEREAALSMVKALPGRRRVTLGADKGYDAAGFVSDLRGVHVAPHVAQKVKGSAIDRRVARHAGYAISLRIRKRVEQIFGWMKTIAGLRKVKYAGEEKIDCLFAFAAAVYNLVRMRNLGLAAP